ncbi:MAG: VWA domain-containing protein [Pseudomonadota bacterium]
MAELHFGLPLAALVLPLPWLVRRLTRPAAGSVVALRVPRTGVFVTSGVSLRGRSSALLIVLAWLCLVGALCQPHRLGDTLALPQTGRDLIMAMDISGSMEERDFVWQGRRMSRIAAVREVASDFTRRRVGDRVGLVVFAERAYVQVPLTFDLDSVSWFLRDAIVGLAGRSTSIGDAIGLSIKRLKDRPVDARVIVLLTDGSNTSGELSVADAITLATRFGVRVHTIGVGGAQQPLFGSRVNSTPIDENALVEIAERTGGQYFRAANTDDLTAVYERIDRLEPSNADAPLVKPRQPLFHLALGAALGLFSLGLALRWWSAV